MVQRKKIKSLEDLSLLACSSLVFHRCKYIAEEVVKFDTKKTRNGVGDTTEAFSILGLNNGVEAPLEERELLLPGEDLSAFSGVEQRQLITQTFIQDLKRYIWSCIPWYLYSKVVNMILEGIINCVEEIKATWKLGTNMPVFTLQVWAMVKIADIIQHRQLKVLKIDAMPKMLRSNVLRNLDRFPELRQLGLTAGNSLFPYVIRGIQKMHNLVSFSLKYNCNNDILSALTAARSTLKVLDIECSRMISDECVPYILELVGVEELSISKTCLSSEAQAKLLMNLKEIKLLPRGDYLCEALGWIAWDEMNVAKPYPVFKIRNFWSSEVYYFHPSDEMLLVAEMCPHVEKMLFMFQDKYTCPLNILANFKNLKELELWGGDFYEDEFEPVLQTIGQNLTSLELHHFESLDTEAVGLISLLCPYIRHLGFSGCGFNDYAEASDQFIDQDRRRNKEIENIMEPFLELESLSISCPCPPRLLFLLLKQSINLRKLLIGLNCPITDEIFEQVFMENKLQHLEEFEVRKSDNLSMETVSRILLHCDKIRSIMDVSYWTKVSRTELDDLAQHMADNNIDMKLSETIERQVSLYEICQSQLKERYGQVEWFGGD